MGTRRPDVHDRAPTVEVPFVWRFGSDEAQDMFGGELRELSILIFGDLFLVSVLHL
jgi:hypothetical protein